MYDFITFFLINSPADNFGFFPTFWLLWINHTMNIYINIFKWTYVFFFSWVDTQSRIGYCKYLTFKKQTDINKVAVPFYILISNYESSIFSTSFYTTCYCLIFCLKIKFKESEIKFHPGLTVNFQMVKNLSIFLYTY